MPDDEGVAKRETLPEWSSFHRWATDWWSRRVWAPGRRCTAI